MLLGRDEVVDHGRPLERDLGELAAAAQVVELVDIEYGLPAVAKAEVIWEELDAQYKAEMARELAAVLPDAWSELRDEIEQREADWDRLAQHFESKESCMCGTEMIDYEHIWLLLLSIIMA